MASQPYLSLFHKSLSLSTYSKFHLGSLLRNSISNRLQCCSISKATNLYKNSSESKSVNANSQDGDYSADITDQVDKDNQARETQDVTLEKSLRKFKPSSATKKYFQQSWLRQYEAIVPESERVRKDVADQFGVLSAAAGMDNAEVKERIVEDGRDPNERMQELIPDDGEAHRDRRLNIPLTREGRIGKNAYYYTRKMSILGRQGKIREAINVFDYWMMVRDRVMPNKRTFVVLIGIVGRVGYVDKAFQLYSQMRNLGLDAEDRVYTSLFNACANSPWPYKSLKSAENLLSSMNQRCIPLSLITVKAAIKAMAVCGNYPRAFSIMDEASSRLTLDAECFDHLLMACVADKRDGFSRAVQVWQSMQRHNIAPTTSTFNLLIRSVRDCSIGDPDKFAKSLGLSSGSSELPQAVFLTGSSSDNAVSNINFSRSSQRQLASGEDQVNTLKENSPMPSGDAGVLESHNLHHNVPNFDSKIDAFLTERNESRQKSKGGNHVSYEWWEEQPNERLVSEKIEVYRDTTSLSMEGKYEEKCIDVSSKLVSNEALQNLHKPNASFDHLFASLSEHQDETKQNISKLFPSSENQVHPARCDSPLAVKDIKSAHQRLAMLGGAQKLLLYMSETGACPDIRTYSQLLSCVPDTEQAELGLLAVMEQQGLSPDVDFINDLMMKRNHRHSSDTVKDLLPLMSHLGLTPNMRTYAALALTCFKEHQAHSLLADMEAANIEPNSRVMSHFLYISRTNFSYKLKMLRKMDDFGHSPSPETIKVIEKSITITKKNIVAAEKRKDVDSYYLSDRYQESFRKFLNFYRGWLQRTSLAQHTHPWKAFQQPEKEKEEESDSDTENA